eukprot:5373688-Amphidinium_carterae.1
MPKTNKFHEELAEVHDGSRREKLELSHAPSVRAPGYTNRAVLDNAGKRADIPRFRVIDQ